MKDLNIKFSCQNCKHFVQHCYWRKDKLKIACSGHCLGYNRLRLVFETDFCNRWEITEISETEFYEKIEEYLQRAAKQINDIAAILKADK